MITKIVKQTTYDVAMLFNSCMMFDDITSLIDILIINQLGSLLMPKYFESGLPIKNHFQLSIKSVGGSLNNHH
jgi:hypothetical protein